MTEMKALTLKADGQEITVYAEESELAKRAVKWTGYERVREGDVYFSRGRNISPIKTECDNERDDSSFARGDYVNDKNLFYDRERADELHDRLVQWQALNDEPVDWGDFDKQKYCIQFDCHKKEIYIGGVVYIRDEGVVYFTTFEKTKEAIEAFLDELMWYYTKYRSRLDEPRKGEDE